jgi:hypothetical protein
MTPLAQARLLGGIILAILICLGLWYLRHDGYEAGKNEIRVEWDADKIKRDEAQREALIAYANRITQAQEQHDHDQVLIDHLHDDADSVRIHLSAACNSASAGTNSDGGAGLLQSRVDQLFADFQHRVGSLIARCDQLNIDAIRANTAHPE